MLPVRVFPDFEIAVDELAVRARVLQQVKHAILLHRERFAHLARRASNSLFGGLAKRALYAAMNAGAYALAACTVLMPRSRSSLNSRSCKVRCARSTRPLADQGIGVFWMATGNPI